MDVLLIEDDRTIGKTVQQGLVEAGHRCEWATDGPAGIQSVQRGAFDVVVLDRMLPGIAGDVVLARLRASGDRTPVILLTARGTIEDRVDGLNLGADDYLVKPFAMVELIARLQAVTRRIAPAPAAKLSCGRLTLDLTNRRVQDGDRQIDLTPTEFTLLELLMRHQGQVVTRKMMCEHVWGFEWEGPTNVIEVHVNRLRKKLDRERDESTIRTVRGRGYALALGE